MKADLDRLMHERNLDALVLFPTEFEDPYRAYLSSGAHFSGGTIKRRDMPPVLISNAMEIEEAAKSGLTVYSTEDFGESELMRTFRGDHDGRLVAFYRRVFDRLGVAGRVGVYGAGDANALLRLVGLLSEALAGQVEFVTETVRDTIFDAAYETKDPAELIALREVGRQTSAVMRAAREWIAGHRAAGDTVVKADGAPLTIGDVKRYVRGQLFERDLEDPEGMIFAQGRDAALPHSKGEADQPLKLGESIVFDLFPRRPGGYFHDMTRTWSIGYARPEVQAAYDAVMEAFRRSMELCKPSVSTREPQVMVCEYFESQGHPTVLNTPGTTKGYVHSLAHGVGLNVHEAPYFPTFSDAYTLKVGSVFTVEPGLYYADEGYGVRIEDTVVMTEAGIAESLTDCPYDLVIELKG
jgi:Xaa-Pro aminopeptidase